MSNVGHRITDWVNVRRPTTFVQTSPSPPQTQLPLIQKPLVRLSSVVQTEPLSDQKTSVHSGTESPTKPPSSVDKSTDTSDGNASDAKPSGSTTRPNRSTPVRRPVVSEFIRGCYRKLLKDGTDEQKAIIDSIYKLEAAVTALDASGPAEMKYTMHIGSNLAGTPQSMIEFDNSTLYTAGTNRGFSHSVFSDINPGVQIFDRIGLQVRVHYIRVSFIFFDEQNYTTNSSVKSRDYPMRWIVWRQKILSNTVVCDITPNSVGIPEQSGALLWDPFDTNPRTGTSLSEDTTVAAGYSPNAISRLNNHVYHDKLYHTDTGGAVGAASASSPPAFNTWQRPSNTTGGTWHHYEHRFPGGLRVSYLDDTTNTQAPIENDIFLSWVTDKPPYVASGTGTSPNRRYMTYRTEIFFTDA